MHFHEFKDAMDRTEVDLTAFDDTFTVRILTPDGDLIDTEEVGIELLSRSVTIKLNVNQFNETFGD